MSLTLSRLDCSLEIWQPRALGFKPTQTVPMQYQSGQSDPPVWLLKLANRFGYPSGALLGSPTGRIKLVLTSAYWQGDKLQAREVYNEDPLSTGMLTTLDGAYANAHGFTVESIGCGGFRHVLLKVNGTSLSFADQLEVMQLVFPSAA